MGAPTRTEIRQFCKQFFPTHKELNGRRGMHCLRTGQVRRAVLAAKSVSKDEYLASLPSKERSGRRAAKMPERVWVFSLPVVYQKAGDFCASRSGKNSAYTKCLQTHGSGPEKSIPVNTIPYETRKVSEE